MIILEKMQSVFRELKELAKNDLKAFKKRLKARIKKIRGYLQKLPELIIFYVLSYRLKFLYFFRNRVKKHKKWPLALLTVLYFVVLLCGSLYLGQYIHIVGNPDSVAFLTSAGAMAGGMLAIIFSLGILLMGNAAEKIPVGFYESAAKDWFHNLSFVVIGFSSFSMFMLALLPVRVISFQITIFLIGTIFYFTFVFYRRVKDRLNPNNVLRIAASQSLKSLKRSKKYANEFADVLMKQPNKKAVTKEFALAAAYQYVQPEFMLLNSRLTYLFDYHDKLFVANEKQSALIVLGTIESIIEGYLTQRKDSSLVLPTGMLLTLTSDSQNFLSPNLERLNAIADKYMKADEGSGVRKVISVYTNLMQVASEVSYPQQTTVDNPVFTQFTGYFSQLVESACSYGYIESLFQAARAYGRIGQLVIAKNLQTEFGSIYRNLNKIAYSGAKKHSDVVMQEVISSYCIIIQTLVASKYFCFSSELKHLLEKLREIIYLGFLYSSQQTLQDSYFITTSLSSPFDSLSRLASQAASAANAASTAGQEAQVGEWQSIFMVIAEETRATLRFLSEKMMSPGNLLMNDFSRVIKEIAFLMLELSKDPIWSDKKDELLRKIGWYLHQPEWFTSGVKKFDDNNAFDSLVEVTAKIGLKALQQDEDKLASDAVEILYRFAYKLMETGCSSHGYTEPRIIERACYLGVLALKLGKTEIVDSQKVKILQFEKDYLEKCYNDAPAEIKSSASARLLNDMMGLVRNKHDIYGHQMVSILEDSKDTLFTLVDGIDIEKYIYEIWKVVESSGELDELLNSENATDSGDETNGQSD